MIEKTCTKCGKIKPIDGFYRKVMSYRRLSVADGERLNIMDRSAFYAECKECFKMRIADYKRREKESCQTRLLQPAEQRRSPER